MCYWCKSYVGEVVVASMLDSGLVGMAVKWYSWWWWQGDGALEARKPKPAPPKDSLTIDPRPHHHHHTHHTGPKMINNYHHGRGGDNHDQERYVSNAMGI